MERENTPFHNSAWLHSLFRVPRTPHRGNSTHGKNLDPTPECCGTHSPPPGLVAWLSECTPDAVDRTQPEVPQRRCAEGVLRLVRIGPTLLRKVCNPGRPAQGR